MKRKRLWRVAVLLFAMAARAGGQEQEPRVHSQGMPGQGVKIIRDLEYVPGGHERQRLDLYLPEKAARPLPVVVWIHGGGWQAGSKDRTPAAFLADRGYAVASLNYRLSQHAVFPAQIHDCMAAIRWLRANAGRFGLDRDHIGAWGESAGGHLAALLGTTGNATELEGPGGNLDQSSRVQAVVDFYGPANFLTLAPRPNRVQFLGGQPQQLPAKAAQASPASHVSRNAAPFLILHGNQDNKVPLSQSVELADSLKKSAVEVTLHVVEGAGHGGPQFSTAENRRLVEQFFDRHLRAAK